MGKKTKIGKQRKDKFYKLAKETGFRSRASFKLVQLNRKFEFLQKSRILIDLCAAPGGWLQIAHQSMPVSSLIIGVDLVSIRPLPNVITLQEDITTDKCRQALKKQLKTWKADTILHDGSPNVGKSWIHDAFAQAELTLSALKLATEMLAPGGWFITKVFRSKDYNALLWVFGKLFKKVHVTKPQASRNESAEIYVVCQSYVAPNRIDPKFLDPSHLFKDVEQATKSNIMQISKRKAKAEGYEEGDKSVFNKLKASDFIFNDSHLEALSQSTEIIFDLDDIYNHRTTTAEVKESCKDLKVLGKAELRGLLNWRKNIRAAMKQQEEKEKPTNEEVHDEDKEEAEIDSVLKEANDLELSKYQELKKKKKKMVKERKKTEEKVNLKMIIKDDVPIVEEDTELFNLTNVQSKKGLNQLDDEDDLEFGESNQINDEDEENPTITYRSTYDVYSKHLDRESWSDGNEEKSSSDSEASEKEEELPDVEDGPDDDVKVKLLDDDGDEDDNPLLVHLMGKTERKAEAVHQWFDKEDFNTLDEDDDLDFELITESATPIDKSRKRDSKGIPVKNKLSQTAKAQEPIVNEDENDEDEEEDEEQKNEVANSSEKKKKKKRIKLDPEGLALGSLMIRSKKTKRDIIDDSYNRYASNDEGLPDWFVKDEAKHNKKQMPVTAEMVAEYKAQLREINARPLKKVVQAKTRKKRRAMRKMEKARKRAEAVTDNVDMGEKEKIEQLKSIYKKALVKKDISVTYVVAKKGVGKRGGRPAGVKGRYKVVDKRMKKDDRINKINLKKKGRKPMRNKRKKK